MRLHKEEWRFKVHRLHVRTVVITTAIRWGERLEKVLLWGEVKFSSVYTTATVFVWISFFFNFLLSFFCEKKIDQLESKCLSHTCKYFWIGSWLDLLYNFRKNKRGTNISETLSPSLGRSDFQSLTDFFLSNRRLDVMSCLVTLDQCGGRKKKNASSFVTAYLLWSGI